MLHDLARTLPHCEVLINCQTMSAAWGARMAISAAGSTAFELAATGTPGLLVSVAENQIRLGEFCTTGLQSALARKRRMTGKLSSILPCKRPAGFGMTMTNYSRCKRAALRLGLANGAKLLLSSYLIYFAKGNDAKRCRRIQI